MATFILITEGITDQAVLETLLEICCAETFDDDIEVNFLQPSRDATDRSRAVDAGGWERVLEHCTFTDRVVEALSLNDYLVIHIDTDCCEHPNFGIKITQEGVRRKVSEIVSDVKNTIIHKLGNNIYQEYKDRLIFAICVEAIECWLIPLFAKSKNGKGRILNCDEHLRRALRTQDLSLSKDYKCYQSLASKFKKKKDVEEAAVHNESLHIFMSTLP